MGRNLIAILAGLTLPTLAHAQAFTVETVTDELTPLEAATATHPGNPPLDLIVTISDDGSGNGNRLDAFRLPEGDAGRAVQTHLPATPDVFGLSHRIAHDPALPTAAIAGSARGTGRSYVSLIDDFRLVVLRTRDGVTWERRQVSPAQVYTSSEVGIVASGLLVVGYNAATFAIDAFRSLDGGQSFQLLGSFAGTTLLVDVIYNGYRIALATRPDSDELALLYSQTKSAPAVFTAPRKSSASWGPTLHGSWAVARAAGVRRNLFAASLAEGVPLDLRLEVRKAGPGTLFLTGMSIPGQHVALEPPHFLETLLTTTGEGAYAALYQARAVDSETVHVYTLTVLRREGLGSSLTLVLGETPAPSNGGGMQLGERNGVIFTGTLNAADAPFDGWGFTGRIPESSLSPDFIGGVPVDPTITQHPTFELNVGPPSLEDVFDDFESADPDYALKTVVISSLEYATHRGCLDTETVLCNQNNRFDVRVAWRDHAGRRGSGRARPLTGESGYFWFFDEANVELLVKVLDGCGVNNRAWVFAGGLTDVEVDIVVTDRFTGQQKTYHNPRGRVFQPIQDTSAFGGVCPLAATSAATARPALDLSAGAERTAAVAPVSAAADQAACAPGPTVLCLDDRRFRVEVNWRTG